MANGLYKQVITFLRYIVTLATLIVSTFFLFSTNEDNDESALDQVKDFTCFGVEKNFQCNVGGFMSVSGPVHQNYYNAHIRDIY